MTILPEELMRQFLIVLAQERGGLKLSLAALEAVDPNTRVEFYRDGPLMAMKLTVPKDRWGRVLDRCGQVKCLKCDVSINYAYSDGSKRTLCAKHE